MGFDVISSFAHTMEDIFGEIRNNKMEINEKLFNDLFKANDVLGKLIAQVKNPDKKVSYRGIKTKLEVFLKNNKAETQAAFLKQTGSQLKVKRFWWQKRKNLKRRRKKLFFLIPSRSP